MKIPFFSFDKRNQDVKSETLKLFESFFDSKWYVLGKYTESFETAYAEFNRTLNCVGVGSGLEALHLALRALGIKKGDEVIVPSNTYIATVLAVSYTGATPIFVEPKIDTCNLDPEKVVEAITSKTKCIMPVHLYGQACEMDAIMDIALSHGLMVVEDNAQAHGATYNGKITGSFGHINATSFYPTKNIGALGEAGAITTDDLELAQKVKVLRNYGSQERYYNEVIGYNNRIDEFEAAYLTVALKYIDKWTQERALIAKEYRDGLSGLEDLEMTKIAESATTVNHLFVVKTKQRDALRNHLSKAGIGTQIHYPVPPHLQKAYDNLGHRKGDFPIAEELAETSLSLPIWPGLSMGEVVNVVDEIVKFYR